jgi:hypothetical protein
MSITSLEKKPSIKRYLLIASLFWTACVVLAGVLVTISTHRLHVEHTAIRLAETLIDRDRGTDQRQRLLNKRKSYSGARSTLVLPYKRHSVLAPSPRCHS